MGDSDKEIRRGDWMLYWTCRNFSIVRVESVRGDDDPVGVCFRDDDSVTYVSRKMLHRFKNLVGFGPESIGGWRFGAQG